MLSEPDGRFDVVHIPDHFRGGTVDNNILRIALTDPAMVYLIDGIWETLLNKDHFAEYALNAIKNHSLRNGTTLRLELSHENLVRLFESDELAVSPSGYARRIRRIASFFRRRQRTCAWLNLIRPDPAYRDRIHYAGNYKCSPVWNNALEAVNRRVSEALDGLDAPIIDLHALMGRAGGEQCALIDQWHFTSEFHILIAAELKRDIRQRGANFIVSGDHVSRRHMLPNRSSGDAMIAYGDTAKTWAKSNSDQCIAGIAASEEELVEAQADIAVLCHSDEEERERIAERLLAAMPERKIILFPEEFEGIRNPPTES